MTCHWKCPKTWLRTLGRWYPIVVGDHLGAIAAVVVAAVATVDGRPDLFVVVGWYWWVTCECRRWPNGVGWWSWGQ